MPGLLMFQFFGPINQPPGVDKYGDFDRTGGGIIFFGNNLLKLVVVIAGLFTLINFMIAGYTFLSAGNEPKKMAEAWGKIWQSMLGLLVVAGSFVLAAIVGWLIFGHPNAILNPVIYTP